MVSGRETEEDTRNNGSQETTPQNESSAQRTIGGYHLLDKLGEDSIGEVFRAFDPGRSRVVALRILSSSITKDPLAYPRIKKVIEALKRLNHPNLVRLLGAGTELNTHFLLTEYVEGQVLADLVGVRGPMRIGEVIQYGLETARGMVAAHQKGIVHLALSPSTLILDGSGTIRVDGLGLSSILDSSTGDASLVDFRAPERSDALITADYRADIYSLGCILYFLATGHPTFIGETVEERIHAHRDQPVPSLLAARPDAPLALDVLLRRMMAKRPEDRPQSMSEVTAILETCNCPSNDEITTPIAAESQPDSNHNPNTAVQAPSSFEAGKQDNEVIKAASSVSDQSLEELLGNVSSEKPRLVSTPTHRPFQTQSRSSWLLKLPRLIGRPTIFLILGVFGLLIALFMRFLLFGVNSPVNEMVDARRNVIDTSTFQNPVDLVPSVPKFELVVETLFDGTTNRGWMLTNRKPLPQSHVQGDGLNPHGTGSYIVVYQKKLGDFVLDFDYKLSKGCNSGVFIRVGDLSDPVNSGIEIALDDTVGTTYVDSGAIYDLVAPTENPQLPAGQWNHMSITAEGPLISVTLNGKEVSWINLDIWKIAGKRPDGTDHKFKKRPIADLPRTGYIGFQDHGRDCWFRNIKLKTNGKI